MENNSMTVPLAANPIEEVRARWAWAEPSVWTDRMLAALEQGVKEGIRWTNLSFTKHRLFSLKAAYAAVVQSSRR